jgi:hypothetical protein
MNDYGNPIVFIGLYPRHQFSFLSPSFTIGIDQCWMDAFSYLGRWIDDG